MGIEEHPNYWSSAKQGGGSGVWNEIMQRESRWRSNHRD